MHPNKKWSNNVSESHIAPTPTRRLHDWMSEIRHENHNETMKLIATNDFQVYHTPIGKATFTNKLNTLLWKDEKLYNHSKTRKRPSQPQSLNLRQKNLQEEKTAFVQSNSFRSEICKSEEDEKNPKTSAFYIRFNINNANTAVLLALQHRVPPHYHKSQFEYYQENHYKAS